LRLAEHDLVGSHAGFALRHAVKFDFEADVAASTHFASGAGQAGCAHILNANDSAGLHSFKAGFEQELFEKGIADLHVRTLGLGGFAEFLAGHGCAVDAVATGLRSDIYDRIAFSGGLGVENFVAAHQA
jgi:hypothetical protein